mmetsp:Transcript_32719/g.41844  ORF Transcript_32719/g.41844 Transcript_32719/m.41844 type:complete len:102 (+) Transcript_32719:811-1116(+)
MRSPLGCLTIHVANSTPTVGFRFSLKLATVPEFEPASFLYDVKQDNKFVFPTPGSPTKTILYITSYCSVIVPLSNLFDIVYNHQLDVLEIMEKNRRKRYSI